jgi:hypothetical protein
VRVLHPLRQRLAHLDRDPLNCGEDNLAYLCLPHHDDYDTNRCQTKNLTASEAKTASDPLYEFIENGGDLASGQRPVRARPDAARAHPVVGGAVGEDRRGERNSANCTILLAVLENPAKTPIWPRDLTMRARKSGS